MGVCVRVTIMLRELFRPWIVCNASWHALCVCECVHLSACLCLCACVRV